jgi:ribulose-phosphate 3-epimerase
VEIIPAILKPTEKEVMAAIWRVLVNELNTVQLDVMDGEFVPNNSFGTSEFVAKQKTVLFEPHLMIVNPLGQLAEWEKLPNVIRTIFHYEALSESDKQNLPDKFSIAINPKTPVEILCEFGNRLNHVLFMGVQPGFSGQQFDYTILNKISYFNLFRTKNKLQTTIGVDGGVNKHTAPLLRNVGVDILNASSFLFADFVNNLKFLQSL